MPRNKIEAMFFASSNGIVYKKESIKVSGKLRYQLFDKFNNTCNYCGVKVSKHRSQIKFMSDNVLGHIDHILPIARGGLTNIDNLQLLCESCNQKKGAN